MRKITIFIGLLMLAIFLYPPSDRVTPATGGTQYGSYVTAGTSEQRYNAGFVYIGDVGGSIQIRYGQWLAQMGGAFALGCVLGALVKR